MLLTTVIEHNALPHFMLALITMNEIRPYLSRKLLVWSLVTSLRCRLLHCRAADVVPNI